MYHVTQTNEAISSLHLFYLFLLSSNPKLLLCHDHTWVAHSHPFILNQFRNAFLTHMFA